MKNFIHAKKMRYGAFGGVYLPEVLMPSILDLQSSWKKIRADKSFHQELKKILSRYAGRPTAFTEAKRFSKAIDGPSIFLKREDLLHTGAHKINNSLGQCLLAKYMGKTRIIAETGAGQHGVATASACAYLGLDCVIYMGKVDSNRQAANVLRMKLLGAKIEIVSHGTQTLKDAINEALRDWSASFAHTYYCLGSALGPHPYPEMVAAFQRVIGEEVLKQSQKYFGKKPDMIVACIGGGSNAIGIFAPFIADPNVKLVGVEAGGYGNNMGEHAARLISPKLGVLHGCSTYILQNDSGQIQPTHSISAGLDYPALGPQHAALFASGRASYVNVTDKEAFAAFHLLAKTEGIIPALESSHALAYVIKTAKKLPRQTCVVINLSGRGDKDLAQIEALA
jgi:tryptophan synthase beta subunit